MSLVECVGPTGRFTLGKHCHNMSLADCVPVKFHCEIIITRYRWSNVFRMIYIEKKRYAMSLAECVLVALH